MLPNRHSRGDAPRAFRLVNDGAIIRRLLWKQFTEQNLCDVELVVGDSVYKCHRLILSMVSPVFCTMLDSKWMESSKGSITLHEELECEGVFKEFLLYMYTGGVAIMNSNALPLLILADKYDVGTLGAKCRDYMGSHYPAHPQHLKIVSWYNYAQFSSWTELAARCAETIKQNFEGVIHSKDFLNMKQDMLESLLADNDLVVADEYTLYEAVIQWLQNNTETLGDSCCRTSREDSKLLEDLMGHIRFPLMRLQELYKIEASHFFVKNQRALSSVTRSAWASHLRSNTWTVAPESVKPVAQLTVERVCLSGSVLSGHGSPIGSSFVPPCTLPVKRRRLDSCLSISSSSSDDDQLFRSRLRLELSHPFSAVSSSKQGSITFSAVSSSNDASFCGFGKKRKYNFPCRRSARLKENEKARSGASKSCFEFRPDYKSYPLRNYVSDHWSMELNVSNVANLAMYSPFVYIFSSPQLTLPTHDGSSLEWEAVLYPRGVHFPAAEMIGIPHNFVVPEANIQTVRLSLMCKTPLDKPCRVNVSVLAIAHACGENTRSVEYVGSNVTKTMLFDKDCLSHNIDDIVPFAELCNSSSKFVHPRTPDEYLIHPWKADQEGYFKLLLIIKPTELSH